MANTEDIIRTYDSAGTEGTAGRIYEFTHRQRIVSNLGEYPFDEAGPHLPNSDYVFSTPYEWAAASLPGPGSSLLMPNTGTGVGDIGDGCTVGAFDATASSTIGTPTPGLVMVNSTRSDFLFPFPTSLLGGGFGNAGFRRVKIQGKFKFTTGTAADKGILAIGYNYAPGSGTKTTLVGPSTSAYYESGPYYAGGMGNIIEVRSSGDITRFAWDGKTDGLGTGVDSTNYNSIASETISAPTPGTTYYFQLTLAYVVEGTTPTTWRNVQSASTFKLGTSDWDAIDDNAEVADIFPDTIDYSTSGEQWTVFGRGTWGFGGRNEENPWNDASYEGYQLNEIRVLAADQNNESTTAPTYGSDVTIWRDNFARDGHRFITRRPTSSTIANGAALKSSFWAVGEPCGPHNSYDSSGDYPKGGRGTTIETEWADAAGAQTASTDSLAVIQSQEVTDPSIGPYSSYGKRLQAPGLDVDMEANLPIMARTVRWDTTGGSVNPTLKWRDIFLIDTTNIKKLLGDAESATANVETAIADNMEVSVGFNFRYKNMRGHDNLNPEIQDQTGIGVMARVGRSVGSGGKYSIMEEPTTAKYTAYFGYVFAGDNPPSVTIQKTAGNEFVMRPDWIIGRWVEGVEYFLAAGNGNLFPKQILKGNGYRLSLGIEEKTLQLKMLSEPTHGAPSAWTTLGTVTDSSDFTGYVDISGSEYRLSGLVSYLGPRVSAPSSPTYVNYGSTPIDCSLLLNWFDINHAKIGSAGTYWDPPTESLGFVEPPKTNIRRSGGTEDVGDAPYAPAQMETVKLDYAKYLFPTDSGTEKRMPAYSQFFGGANVPRQYMKVTWLVLDSELETLLSFLKGCRDNGKAFGLQNSDATASSAAAYYAFVTNMAPIPYTRQTGGVFKVGPVDLIQSFGAAS